MSCPSRIPNTVAVINIVNVAFYCHQHVNVAFYCHQHCQCGVLLSSTLSMWRFIVINIVINIVEVAFYCGVLLSSTLSMWRFIGINIVNVAFYYHQRCQCVVLLSSKLSSTLSMWLFFVINIVNVAFCHQHCHQHCQCGVLLWRFIVINIVNVAFCE